MSLFYYTESQSSASLTSPVTHQCFYHD